MATGSGAGRQGQGGTRGWGKGGRGGEGAGRAGGQVWGINLNRCLGILLQPPEGAQGGSQASCITTALGKDCHAKQ